ncbi:MAG: Rpn family recombination-promoting nuclease/putative transposase, partial [Spirochaetota bacterium]
MPIQNPHDKFFKETFSDKANAADFIKGTCPPEVLKNLVLSTLTLEKSSYIDEELKEQFSDLVYSCQYGKKRNVSIVLLFEHKSYVPQYPHVQLLKYLLNLWKEDMNARKPLTVVIPLVLYHGRRRWRKRDFSTYFDTCDQEVRRFLPEFDYLLTDLSKFTDREIKEALFHRLSLR